VADEQEPRPPSEEELREALLRVSVSDVLVQALGASVSVASLRLAPESRDLAQARLAIEALRALEPVLREGGVEDAVVRELERARADLQLAYASAAAPSPRDTPE
jgi:hypothetical protein